MNALDLLYSAAAHSGSSERGQQRSDSHAERNEQDTMRAYAVEQMRSQQEAEERWKACESLPLHLTVAQRYFFKLLGMPPDASKGCNIPPLKKNYMYSSKHVRTCSCTVGTQ